MAYKSFEEYWRDDAFQAEGAKADHHETWKAAQESLLADPMVVDLRNANWPEWASSVVLVWSRQKEPWSSEFRRIKRPAPAWRPKAGENFWHHVGDDFMNELNIWLTVLVIRKGQRFAAVRSVDELTWTWEQFVERGDVWEVE